MKIDDNVAVAFSDHSIIINANDSVFGDITFTVDAKNIPTDSINDFASYILEFFKQAENSEHLASVLGSIEKSSEKMKKKKKAAKKMIFSRTGEISSAE